MIDLRLGRWQDVLADVECDAVICDPPFGERTHAGHNEKCAFTLKVGGPSRPRSDGSTMARIEYEHWTPDGAASFVARWTDRVRGWMVILTSHDLIPAIEQAFADAGRLSFAPVPCVTPGMAVRLAGDGPSSWSVYAMAARPRSRAFASWGALPGAYISAKVAAGSGRGKPIALMRAIVRDYSRPGDLVCDPFAGYGTTARACASLGRRFVGAECDADAYAEAQRRLADVVTVDVQGVQRVRQEALL